MTAILADDIFKCIFLNDNDIIPIQISLKFVSMNWFDKKTSIGSGNGLVPKRRQAITWSNIDQVYCRVYAAALGGDELRTRAHVIQSAMQMKWTEI